MLAARHVSSRALRRSHFRPVSQRCQTRPGKLPFRSPHASIPAWISHHHPARRTPPQMGLALLDRMALQRAHLRSRRLPHLLLESLQLIGDAFRWANSCFPWIQQGHAGALEISYVPADDGHSVNQRSGGDHCVSMRAGIRHMQSRGLPRHSHVDG